MQDNTKKYLWWGVGLAAAGGALWWLYKRGRKNQPGALPQQAPIQEAGAGTDGQLGAPPPVNIKQAEPDSVPGGEPDQGGSGYDDQSGEF